MARSYWATDTSQGLFHREVEKAIAAEGRPAVAPFLEKWRVVQFHQHAPQPQFLVDDVF